MGPHRDLNSSVVKRTHNAFGSQAEMLYPFFRQWASRSRLANQAHVQGSLGHKQVSSLSHLPWKSPPALTGNIMSFAWFSCLKAPLLRFDNLAGGGSKCLMGVAFGWNTHHWLSRVCTRLWLAGNSNSDTGNRILGLLGPTLAQVIVEHAENFHFQSLFRFSEFRKVLANKSRSETRMPWLGSAFLIGEL